jgi:hypothetical protein
LDAEEEDKVLSSNPDLGHPLQHSGDFLSMEGNTVSGPSDSSNYWLGYESDQALSITYTFPK